MDLKRKPNGKWELRWREGKTRRSRTFDRKKDAEAFEVDRRRRQQLGPGLAELELGPPRGDTQ